MNCKNLTILFLLQGLLSCAIERPKGKTEAEILYKEAQKLMKDGRYLLATEKLNTIRSQYPYSYYATHAELLSADVLFAQKNFVEAAAAYIVFKDFHPKHKKLSFVLWRIGESFFKQMPSSFDRDLASGIESIKYFKRLIDLYPESEYASKAKREDRFLQKTNFAKRALCCRLLLQDLGLPFRPLSLFANFARLSKKPEVKRALNGAHCVRLRSFGGKGQMP